MTELEKYIQTFFGADPADLAKISAYFKPYTLKKNAYFLKKGEQADKLGFLQAGIVREFVTHNDKEVTKWISTQGYFVVDLASFIFHQPARWHMQALSDCSLLVIDQKDYLQIGKDIPRWPELEKLFIAKCFTLLEERMVMQLSMTAQERYKHLFQFNKSLFNTVPLQYLASMLGMTPETLSRLRKKTSAQTS